MLAANNSQTSPPYLSDMRVAIVHDALVNSGGAERTLTFMCEAFPDAPVFTSAYLPNSTFQEFRLLNIHTLPGAGLVQTERRAKQLLPLWIWGFRYLNLQDYDVVLTSTTFAAKYVNPSATVPHLCYCYVPFRWLWNPAAYSEQSVPFKGLFAQLASYARPMLRRIDYQVMQSVTRIATSCQNMAREIELSYQRDSEVIYPPIRISDYHLGDSVGEYYLCVSRLVSHKRVDLAIQACQQLGRRLIVVGDGPEREQLMAMSGPTTTFAGRVSDTELRNLYSACRAVIFPSHEDYGIVPLEANASGRPVIAYGVGGVLETLVEGITGVYFSRQVVEDVIEAILTCERIHFDSMTIRQEVDRFDVAFFVEKLRAFVHSSI